jgi:uncharacterized short protein YbdD (DUF466 family)
MTRAIERFRALWHWLRAVSGDDAYDRYVEHWRTAHALQGGKPMTRAEYFRYEQDRKWSRIRRCC